MQREAALGARQGVEIHPQVGHPSVVLASRPATSTTNLAALSTATTAGLYSCPRTSGSTELLRRKTRKRGGEWPSGGVAIHSQVGRSSVAKASLASRPATSTLLY